MRIKPVLFIILVLCCSCSFRALREAKQVVHEADSLFSIGQLYEDTTRLRQAAHTLNRFVHKEELARVYYYLGRNYSLLENDNISTDCYITSAQLLPNDRSLSGRLYCNMAYICAQQQKDSFAIILYQQAAEDFLVVGDTAGYAYMMLDLSYSYANSKQFEKADSIWKIAQSYCSNDKEKSLSMQYKAAYYNLQELGDSALLFLNQANYLSDRVYSDWQYALAYYHLGEMDSAERYSNKIIYNNCAPYGYQIGAYYILSAFAEANGDASLVLQYESERMDIKREDEKKGEGRIRAINNIEQCILHPERDKQRNYRIAAITVFILMIVMLVLFVVLWRKKQRELQTKKSQWDKAEIQIREMTERERLDHVIKTIEWIKTSKIEETLHWKDSVACKQSINYYLNMLADKLYCINSNITIKEIKFCVLILLGFKLEYCAVLLELSPGSMKNSKSRLAQKLRIQSSSLYNFLLDLVCQC